MVVKKSWRDYSKSTTAGASGENKKTGTWRDYSGNKKTGNSSGSSWRNYSKYNSGEAQGEDIVDRLNNWLNSHNSYISNYQNHYSGRKYDYTDSYVSDSADWLNEVSQRKNNLFAEADEIVSYLDQHKDYFNADWVRDVKNTIIKAKDQQYDLLYSAGKDNEYWSKFTPNEEQTAAGYTAEKLYAEWQADQKQYAEDLSFDVKAGEAELEKLKNGRDAYIADQEEKRKQEQNDESFWDKLGRWMGTTPDTSIPLAGANDAISNSSSTNPYAKQVSELEDQIERAKYAQGYEGYMDNMNADDYAANSKYVSTRTDVAKEDALWGAGEIFAFVGGEGDRYDVSKLFYDPLHDYINRNYDAISVESVNDTAFDSYLLGLDKGFLQTMSDEEIGVYNYLYNTQGKESANTFLMHIQSDLEGRKRVQEQAFWAEYAKSDPVGSSVFSTLISPLKGLSYLGQAADMLDDGKMDQNAGYNRYTYIPSTIRSQVSTTIENSGKWGKVGSFAYNTGMSMADFLFSTAVSGGNQAMSLAIMGTGAAADATLAAKDRGLDDGEAFALGTIAGLAEVAMEKVSLGAWLEGDMSEGALKYLLKNALSEGGEEAGTSIVNLLADVMIAGDKSEWNMAMQAYIDQGKSPQEAFGLVAAEQAAQIGLDALGGALSGAAIGGGTYAGTSISSKFQYGNLAKNKDFAQKLTAEGMELNPESKYVQKAKTKVENGKNLTGMQVRNILAANQEQITANDMKKIQKAAEQRLTDLGQTENVSELAEIATKWATGKEITRAERKLITNNENGSKVAHDLLQDSVVEEVKSEGYGKKAIRSILDKMMTSTEHPNAYKSLENRMEGETPAKVSDTGKSVIHGTDQEITLDKKVKVTKFVTDKDTGKITDMVLDVDGKEVKASEIDYEDENQSYLFSAVPKIENITPEDATAIIRDYDPASGLSVGEYLNGVDEAFTYGFHNYSEADLKAGDFAPKLGDTLSNIAYVLGQNAKKNSKTKNTEAVKKMRTAVDAEIEKAAKEGKEAPKARKLTITYNHGGGVVEDISTEDLSTTKKLGKLNKWQRGGMEAVQILHQMGIGTDYEFFTSYFSKTLKDKDGNALEVFLDDNGQEQAAYAGVYMAADGKIRINLNAYSGTKGLTLNALSHELTHFIKTWSLEKYEAMADFLVKSYGEKGVSMHKLVLKEQARLKGIRGKEVSYGKAYDEVVANAFNRMLEDGKVMERIAEIRQIDKSLGDKIIECIRNFINRFFDAYRKNKSLFHETEALMDMKEVFEQLQNMFAEALVEASDNFQANLMATEVGVEPVAVEDMTQYSYSSLAEAAGFKAVENENGTRSFTRDGKAVSEVTIEDIENSPIGAFINFSLEMKDISAADAKRQKQMFADICTMACKTNDFAMTMQFVGSAVFTGMKANADKQYGTTYDFPSICTKTQAVIDAMSAKMMSLGRGLKTDEIVKLYDDVFASGNPVPCPECYVFSRWIGIGGLLDNIKKYQDYYGAMSVDDVAAEYRKMKAEVSKFAEEQGISFGKAKGALTSKLTKEFNKLTEKVEKAENQGEKVKAADRQRLAELEPMMNTVKGMTWLENVYFADSSLKKVNPKFRVPNEVLFDLNNGEAFATQYKDAWAFRTTQGAGYGKAITPYAEARLGEGVLVTNNTSNAIKGKAQGSLNNYFLNQKGKLDKQSRETLKKARLKQKIQAFIGGQRFQSTSDARYENASDYLLAALEMQAMRGMVQVYTKVDGAVPAFSAWGFSINQSLMPLNGGLDANGNVKDTGVGGMKPSVAFENRNKHETAGTITIGVNDNHIRKMFNEWVRDFIIPYHASGGKADVVAAFRSIQEGKEAKGKAVRSTDYSRTQSDKVLSDEVLRWQGKTEAQIQRIHEIRDARIAILTGGKPNMTVVRSNRFLSALYDKLNGGEWDGVKLAKSKVESQIFPNEFWDQTVTYEKSAKITKDYLEYCNDLGFLHRFSGTVPSNGRLVPVNGYDQNGNRVQLTDLAYQYDENGNMTNDVEPFFWKVLTDRRMYDNSGNYLPQKVVALNDTTADTVTGFAKNNQGREYDKAKAEALSQKILKGEQYSSQQTDYGVGVLQNKKYWYPNMTNAEIAEVQGIARNEAKKTDNYLGIDAKWLYNNQKGHRYFALYSTAREEITLLYACKDESAEYEHGLLKDYIEWEDSLYEGTDSGSTTISQILERVENAKAQRSSNRNRTVGARSNAGNAGVHSRYQRKRPSAAFYNCLKNIEEVQQRYGVDDHYLFAVDRGDYATAQRMVDEASENAGFTTSGYHGSRTPGFTVVDKYSWLWLARDKIVANEYGSHTEVDNIGKPHDKKGVYAMRYNLGNNLVVYADGNSWGELPVTEDEYPGVYADEETGYITTNAMAEWAERNGYDSITFVDVDDGGLTTVDVVFNPNRDVKSADPITYDDDGNIIPISKRFKKDNDDIRYSSQQTDLGNAPTFYSQMGKVVESMKQDKFGASSVISMLRGRGVKAEEIRWSGIQAFLDGKKSVTKAELLEFIKGSMLHIDETVFGGRPAAQSKLPDNYRMEETTDDSGDPILNLYIDDELVDTFEHIFDGSISSTGDSEIWAMNETDLVGQILNHYAGMSYDEAYLTEANGPKWGDYKLNGGENYRELVFKIPGSTYANNAMQGHWGNDAQGVLAHARMQDFDVGGKKMLFIEEIQSDWHNAGAKNGYGDLDAEKARIDAEYDERLVALAKWQDKLDDYNERSQAGEYIEDYDDVYDEYMSASARVEDSERRIREMENGYHTIAQDAPFKDNYHEFVLKRLLRMAAEEGYDSIGWTTADIQSKRWSDEFAEGYRIEYDQDIPKFLKKYGKQWGAEVGKTEITTGVLTDWEADMIEKGIIEVELPTSTVWSMDITPAMKKSVLTEGQAMYSSQKTDLNVGYHAGDLGKSEGHHMQGGGRSTGHFGTGTYFVSNPKALDGYNTRNGKPAPIEKVYFDNYNLYRIYSDEVGLKLHRNLQVLDGGVSQEFLDAASKGDYSASDLRRKANELADSYDNEVWNEDLGDFYSEDYFGAHIRAYTETLQENGVEFQSFEEWYNEYSGESPTAEDYEDYQIDYYDYLKDTIAEADENRNTGYPAFRDAYFDLWMRFGKKQTDAALQNVVDHINKLRPDGEYNYDLEYGQDSNATVFMKSLGYEGINVSGTGLDNTTYGSVIYDLKGKDLARKKEIGTARYSTQQTDNITNRHLLANAFEGITKSSAEYKQIQKYKSYIAEIESLDKKLQEFNQEIRRIRFTKGAYDAEKLQNLEAETEKIAEAINKYDRYLVSIEASDPIRKLIDRERVKAAKKTKDHVNEIQQNKKVRAEQTELRHKIRKAIRDLDKILNRGNKQKNVKEDLQPVVTKALQAAEILFTDNYGNYDMLRNGIKADMSDAEEALVESCAKMLKDLDKMPTDGYENWQARQEAENKLRAKMSKLKEVFARERKRLNNTTVSSILGELADAYASMEKSEQSYVQGAYSEAVHNFLKSLQSEVGGTIVSDMTKSQLESVYAAYKMVLTTVRKANQLFNEGLKMSREQLANAVIKEVINAGGVHGLWTHEEIAMSQFDWNNMKPIWVGNRIGSESFAKLMQGLFEGQYNFARDIEEAKQFKLKMDKKYHPRSWDAEKQYEFESSTGKAFSLNLQQIMSLYAFSKREQAYSHLLNGGFVFEGNSTVIVDEKGRKKTYIHNGATSYKLNEATLNDIINSLTAEQKAYVDEMQAYLSDVMGAKGNEVSMQLYGIKMFLEKFYFPLRSSGAYMERAKEAEMKKQQGQINLVNSGFTHAVKPEAKNPVILSGFMDVWAEHCNEMSMYHSMVLPMEDLRKVYNYSTVHDDKFDSASVFQTIQDAYGKAATDYIDQLYRELNAGATIDPRETPFKKLISNFKKTAVMMSASVVVQQFSSVGRAFAIIDPKYFTGAKVNSDTQLSAVEEMKKYAPVAIIKEMGGFDTGTKGSAKSYIMAEQYGKGERKQALLKDEQYRSDLMGYLPAKADEKTWCAIWEAVKRETKEKNTDMDVKSEEFLKLAGERFSEVIEKTQVYDSVLARSANMRSKTGLMQMATAFLAEPTTTVNLLEDAIRSGNKQHMARAFGAVAVSIVLNNALASLVYAMRDDDEDETYIEKYFQSFTSGMIDDINPLTYYPFLKDVWSLFQGYDVERTDMSVIADLRDAMKKAVSLLGKDTSGMNDDDLAKHNKAVNSALLSLLDAGCSVFGVPFKNVRREANGIINVFSTIGKDLSGERDNSWLSFWDKVGAAVKDTIPGYAWTKDKAKTDKLYDAIVSGDKAYLGRLKSTYKTDSAYESAVRTALRENDSRIHDAAQARYDGNTEEYKRIFLEIKNEGKFSFDDIMSAINSEESKIRNKVEPDKVTSQYSTGGFVEAVAMGNTSEAQAMKEDIIAAKVANGKTQKEAEKEFASAVSTSIGDAFSSGLLDEARAKEMLIEYADKDEEEAASKVSYWAFLDAHPEYEQYKLTEANIRKYHEFAEPAGISMEVFVQFRDRTKGLTNIKDEWGDVEKSVRDQTIDVIDSLPLTWQQKDALYLAAELAESRIWDVPW